jgi:hypothetical protein
MRLPFALVLSAVLSWPTATSAADDETAALIARQRETAETNCKTLQLAPVGKAETANFLVYGASTDPRMKVLAGNLEKQYLTAFKAMQFDKEARPWNGKLAVYVFIDRSQFRSFIRQVEKRSPDDAEQSSQIITGELPHVAVSPVQGKDAVTADTLAGHEVAIALMSARGKGTKLPEWLTQGFARATAAQAAGMPASVRKRVARQLASRSKPGEAWNDMLSIEQRLPLATSVADFLFYGKGLSRPADFLFGFRPDDEKPMKTVADALEAAKLTPEKFEAGYFAWLRSNN